MRQAALAAVPIVGLVLYLVSVEALTAALRAHGRPETGLFVLLRVIGWGGWLGWWYEDDCRARRATPAFDMGFFLALAWPLLVVGALFTPRRRQMVLMIVTFIAVYAIAKLVGMAAYALLRS